jgi:hypothetical protein
MTILWGAMVENRQRRRRIRGSFAALQDDDVKQAAAKSNSNDNSNCASHSNDNSNCASHSNDNSSGRERQRWGENGSLRECPP